LIIIYILSLIYQFRGNVTSEPHNVAHGSNSTMNADAEGARVYEHGDRVEAGRSHTGVNGSDAAGHHTSKWSVPMSLGILAISTFAIVFMSEFLVGVVEPVAASLGVRELFLGVIVVPIVGNVAEHLVGVQAAIKNQMDLSMTISLGSSMQIALFVAPLLVFISLLFGPELTLFFSLFEVMVLALSVIIAAFISVDGESNWLEGAMLLGLYVIAGFGFFYL
jgi:Ca2+:H+ antiporter